mmetsp:Transcript_15248/g.46042  ORF Transcript_15248/g.46042 Transcript_15248/m.46042 type:complete len:255 (-) Transcript_15248:5922-6686(-)
MASSSASNMSSSPSLPSRPVGSMMVLLCACSNPLPWLPSTPLPGPPVPPRPPMPKEPWWASKGRPKSWPDPMPRRRCLRLEDRPSPCPNPRAPPLLVLLKSSSSVELLPCMIEARPKPESLRCMDCAEPLRKLWAPLPACSRRDRLSLDWRCCRAARPTRPEALRSITSAAATLAALRGEVVACMAAAAANDADRAASCSPSCRRTVRRDQVMLPPEVVRGGPAREAPSAVCAPAAAADWCGNLSAREAWAWCW